MRALKTPLRVLGGQHTSVSSQAVLFAEEILAKFCSGQINDKVSSSWNYESSVGETLDHSDNV